MPKLILLCFFLFHLSLSAAGPLGQSLPANYYDQDILYENDLIQLTPAQLARKKQQTNNQEPAINYQNVGYFSEEEIQFILSDDPVDPTQSSTLSFQQMSSTVARRDFQAVTANTESDDIEFIFYDFE